MKKALIFFGSLAVVLIVGGAWKYSPRFGSTPASEKQQAAPKQEQVETVSKTEFDKLKADFNTLQGKYNKLKEEKPEVVHVGATIEDIKKVCVGKTTYLPAKKTSIAKSGDVTATARAEAHASVTKTSARAEATASSKAVTEEKKGVVLDRCIFRVKGEIKSETYLADGANTCPIWRDTQLKVYNQNPNDKIWERKYPTVAPM